MNVKADSPELPEGAKRRARNPLMDALMKHVHSSDRFSFASVAASISAVRGGKTPKRK